MTTSNSYFYAAIVAIIAVHVFLAIFVYVAVMEETKPFPPKRDWALLHILRCIQLFVFAHNRNMRIRNN